MTLSEAAEGLSGFPNEIVLLASNERRERALSQPLVLGKTLYYTRAAVGKRLGGTRCRFKIGAVYAWRTMKVDDQVIGITGLAKIRKQTVPIS